MKKLFLTILFCLMFYSDSRADSSLSTQQANLISPSVNKTISNIKKEKIKTHTTNYTVHKNYNVLHNNVGPRPFAWCGWFMRTLFGGGPEYNLARNWAKRGRPSGPQVGAVVVWPHHVGYIVGKANNGQWIVKSGNDSNSVRERPRAVSDAIAFRML